MHCYICGLDFKIGYWEGQCCSESIDTKESENPAKLIDIIRAVVENEIKCVKPTDMICTMCIVLLEQFHKYQHKLQTIRHLVLKSTCRTLQLDRTFTNIDYERKAMSTFTKNKYGSYSCVQCFYKTCFADTIAPHFLYHEKSKKVHQSSNVTESLGASQMKQNDTPTDEKEIEAIIRNADVLELPVDGVKTPKDHVEYETVKELILDLTDVKEEIVSNFTTDEIISVPVTDTAAKELFDFDITKVKEIQIEDVDDISVEYLSAEFDFDEEHAAVEEEEEEENNCAYDLMENTEHFESDNEANNEPFNKAVNPLLCPVEVCGELCKDNDDLHNHLINVHKRCSYCRKLFLTIHRVLNHVERVHHNKATVGIPFKLKKIICEVCQKEYSSKSSFTTHFRQHMQKDKPFQCERCGESFWRKFPYEEHMNSHSQSSSYSCGLCGRKFIRLSSYHLHMRYHENPRPFLCEYCQKSYTSQSALAVHIRSHTGEALYTCEYCGKGFAAKSYYKLHMVVHTQEYPYTCTNTQCDRKGFLKKRDFANHMAKKHGDFSHKSEKQQKFKIALGSAKDIPKK